MYFAAKARQISRMAVVPAVDGLAQRVTNRTRCFNSCWLDSNVETARTSTHHLCDAAVRDQDEFVHVLLYVASLIASPEARCEPSTQSAEEPAIGGQAAMASSEAGSTIWNSCPKLDPNLPLKPAERTWSRRSAPRRDQRICCDLFMRRLTRKLAVPSVIDVPTRRPARWRSA